MNAGLTLLVTFLLFTVGFVLVRMICAVILYQLRGKRIVTCPETMQPAALDIAAGRAVMEALLGKPHPRLIQCSRWPECGDCKQLCLDQDEGLARRFYD